jgi:putative DNA primase/helicase
MSIIDLNKWGHKDEDTKIDFEKVKAIALNNMEMILHRWLPGGKLNGYEYECGDTRGGKGDSCRTNIKDGVGGDFASTERWGDPIDLVATVEGITQAEAARKLEEFLSITESTPVPPPIPKQTEAEKREYSKKLSATLWVEGEACPPTHPYLIKKQVNVDSGIRYHPQTGNILIPLRDGQDILGVQRIDATGDKKVNQGGRLSGCYHVIPGDLDTVYICEGYATAMTVNMATGKTAVMAVSAGNLSAVGEKIAKMYPTARLVFAADNDQGGEKNPGIEASEKAVKQIGRGTVIAPPFPEGQKGDWNDFALIHGAEAVRALLVKQTKQLFVDVHDIASVETEFLIDGVIETPCTGMVFGSSGTGKSFFVIDMALHVASGMQWLGKATKSGPVFYICGEGRHGIPRRVKAWEHHHGCKVPPGRFMVSNLRLSFEPDQVADMVQCIDQLAESIGTPAMVIIDTMARALPGGADENSAKDTNLFFNECDRIQSRYNCTTLVVHHSGHGDSKRARGSSAIKGVLDVEIMLSNNVVEWTKTKDMEPHPPIRYNLDKIIYGEGKRDNSCVITYDTSVKIDKRETATRTAAKSSLMETIKAEGIGADKCTLQGWRDAFKGKFPTVSERAQQKYFKQESKKMADDGLIVIDGALVVIVDTGMKEASTTSNMMPGL